MKDINKKLVYLILAGILALIVVVAWEAYQVASGGRSTFSLVVVEMPTEELFPGNLENHLQNIKSQERGI